MSFSSLFIDTHCHLDFFNPPDLRKQLQNSAKNAGIDSWILPGVTSEEWQAITKLANDDNNIFPAFGLHPLHAESWGDSTARHLESLAPHATAIGEIGLDYTEKFPSRDTQIKAFREQLYIAGGCKKPVILHCRRAFADTIAILDECHLSNGGIVHAFSGSYETAREFLRRGILIGVGGSLTYENAVRLPEVVKAVGLDSLVLETDAPDMAPVPHRGEMNRPEYLLLIAERVAILTGKSLEETASRTTANARRVLKIVRG